MRTVEGGIREYRHRAPSENRASKHRELTSIYRKPPKPIGAHACALRHACERAFTFYRCACYAFNPKLILTSPDRSRSNAATPCIPWHLHTPLSIRCDEPSGCAQLHLLVDHRPTGTSVIQICSCFSIYTISPILFSPLSDPKLSANPWLRLRIRMKPVTGPFSPSFSTLKFARASSPAHNQSAMHIPNTRPRKTP